MSSNRKGQTAPSKYRKPPIEHQFKKGASGNPKGRPPKNKAVLPGSGSLGGGIADRVSAMALDEATRAVTVREGDKVSEMPALQAVLRTMFRAAAQGDTKAAGQLLQVVSRAESARTNAAVEILQSSARYQEKHAAIIEKYQRQGLDPPEVYPHPDDFIIDEQTGEVTIDGPVTKEQAGARKAVQKIAIEALPRYLEVEAALANDPTNRALKREFKELKKYLEFLEDDGRRNVRLEALRQSRRALEAKPPEPEADDAEDQ